ncbi:MAG: RNA polymerase sigma factor [Planctomycetes bacterium]|nr:RNA polymerase sigma factor [Planctomycetota bacterium]
MIPDEELLQRANGGDPDAFETLYRRYRDWAHRLAWRCTGNEQDALDVLQETFIYLLQKLPGLQLTASMTTFLYPVVKHLSLNLRRRRHPETDEEILLAIPAPAEPFAPRTELAAALAALSEEQREVVLMRFLDDMSLDEIATALDVPTGTIKSRLHRALGILRDDPRSREYFLP